MKKEKFNLTKTIYNLFQYGVDPDRSRENLKKYMAFHHELVKQTGLTDSEIEELCCQKQTVHQCAYRILGRMQTKKIDASHIEV